MSITNCQISIVGCLLLLFLPLAGKAQAPQCIYDESGRLVSSKHNIYDDRDRLAVAMVYDYSEKGVVENRQLISYDAQQRISKRMIYSADEVLLMEEAFKYDKFGNLVKRVQYLYDEGKQKIVETRRYRYSKDGKVLHCRYYLDGKLYLEEDGK